MAFETYPYEKPFGAMGTQIATGDAHCGSAQSMRPSQLSSMPLKQFSVVPVGHVHAPEPLQVSGGTHEAPVQRHALPSLEQIARAHD